MGAFGTLQNLVECNYYWFHASCVKTKCTIEQISVRLPILVRCSKFHNILYRYSSLERFEFPNDAQIINLQRGSHQGFPEASTEPPEVVSPGGGCVVLALLMPNHSCVVELAFCTQRCTFLTQAE